MKSNCDLSMEGKTITVLDGNISDHLQGFEIDTIYMRHKNNSKLTKTDNVCSSSDKINRKRRYL